MSDRKILALVGPAGVGKTTLANLLIPLGYHRTRFADNLKQMLRIFLVGQGCSTEVASEMLDGKLKEAPTIYFDGKTPRHTMQTLGTEWRDLISKDLWVNAWERSLPQQGLIVVDDMRYLHEAGRVRLLGGKIVRIERPGTTRGLHSSEREYESIDVDFIIQNDRDPEHMLHQLGRHTHE